MSGIGLDWYKREPASYLKDVQGLSSRQHAVFSVILDLIYAHGGSVNNDPKFISGWISDMGPAAVRTAISDLVSRGMLMIDGDQITQKRAKSEAKTKQNRSETAAKTGKKGGEKSAELRAQAKENNALAQATASSEIQAEKRREERDTVDTSVSTDAGGVEIPPDPPEVIDAKKTAIWSRGVQFLVETGVPERQARSAIGKWLRDHGSAELFDALAAAKEAETGDPIPYITKILTKPAQPNVQEMVRKAAQGMKLNA